MLIAGITTILCHRFKQPVALGYSWRVSSSAPTRRRLRWCKMRRAVETLGQMGVVLLMFSLAWNSACAS